MLVGTENRVDTSSRCSSEDEVIVEDITSKLELLFFATTATWERFQSQLLLFPFLPWRLQNSTSLFLVLLCDP